MPKNSGGHMSFWFKYDRMIGSGEIIGKMIVRAKTAERAEEKISGDRKKSFKFNRERDYRLKMWTSWNILPEVLCTALTPQKKRLKTPNQKSAGELRIRC